MSAAPVALISGSFPPRVCGVGDHAALLAEGLRLRGAPTVVWTGERETAPRDGMIAPVVTGWDSAGIRRLVRDLTKTRPRLVHLEYERGIYNHQSAVPLLLPLLLRRAGLPLVTTFHALDGPRVWRQAHRAALLPLLLASRDIVVCSQRQLSALRRLPVIGGRATLISCGSVIPTLFARAETRPEGPLRLVYFGFVWRGRNIETLLRALQAVQSAGMAATLDVIGGLRDESYRADLDRLAAELGVTAAVRFRGALPVRDVSAALASADLVLLPFESGVSTGRSTLMTALAHRAPIVTYGAADNLSPLFVEGGNLSIAPVGDEADYVARTVALAADAALREKLSRGAAILSEAFSWPAIAGHTLDLPTYRATAG
jgi:glycosyltransferase involved in cell wall biosynthesis